VLARGDADGRCASSAQRLRCRKTSRRGHAAKAPPAPLDAARAFACTPAWC
jgi:hypothetical protein